MSKMKEFIEYYENKINRLKRDDAVVLDSLTKLGKLVPTAENLQETGIYNLVKSLIQKHGKVGEKATELYYKWKPLLVNKNKTLSLKSTVTDSNQQVRVSFNCYETNSKDNSAHKAKKLHSGSPNTKVVKVVPKQNTQEKVPIPPKLNGIPEVSTAPSELDSEFNPHLNIEDFDKSNIGLFANGLQVSENCSEHQRSKLSKIPEPYTIEMKEGMFRVVKVKPKESVPPDFVKEHIKYQHELMTKTISYENKSKDSASKSVIPLNANDFSKVGKLTTQSPVKHPTEDIDRSGKRKSESPSLLNKKKHQSPKKTSLKNTTSPLKAFSEDSKRIHKHKSVPLNSSLPDKKRLSSHNIALENAKFPSSSQASFSSHIPHPSCPR